MTAPAALGEDRGICFRPDDGETVSRWELQHTAQRLLPKQKQLQRCHCTRLRGKAGVEIWRGKRSASFRGLIQCGSVWICPPCAAKIAEHRAKDLQKGIDYALYVGHGVMMTTLTFRHFRVDTLKELIRLFPLALRYLKSGRAYQQLQKDFGIIGEVRALEVTHGDANGWHPHTHAIVFTNRVLTRAERFAFECRLYLLWRAACARAGLGDPTFEHGVHVRPAKEAADYVAKWGFANEVTRSHIKRAKGKGRTPFQLLADAGAGDKRAAWLFREFAECFKGRRQLYYSPGLRQRIGINEELTDQEALALEPEEKELVCVVEPDQWRLVVRYRMRNAVLTAAMQGAAAVAEVLEELRRRVLRDVGTDGSFARWRWYREVEEKMVTI